MRLRLTATGDADPATAWRRYAELDRWPTWSPQIRGVDAGRRRLEPGLTGEVVGPLGVRVPFEVLEVDEATTAWRWRVRVGFVDAVLDHANHPVPGGGTTTELVVTAPTLFALAYRPLAALALRRLVAA